MQLTTFKWVPPFAQGYVRDLCARWALEEVGLPYTLRLIGRDESKSETYLREQPFGQVPILDDGPVKIFESGAIVLYIAEKSDGLLPSEKVARARAQTWVFAALNSVEQYVTDFIRSSDSKETWATEKKPLALAALKNRLQKLETWFTGKEYLEDQFTVGDLMMVTTLRHLVDSGVLSQFKNLDQYVARCQSRPSFKNALAAQIQTFKDNAPN